MHRLVVAVVLPSGCSADAPEAAPPLVVEPFLAVVSLTAGSRHTCGLDASGRAWCWGVNGSGQLGVGGKSVNAGNAHRDPARTPPRASAARREPKSVASG